MYRFDTVPHSSYHHKPSVTREQMRQDLLDGDFSILSSPIEEEPHNDGYLDRCRHVIQFVWCLIVFYVFIDLLFASL